MDTKFKVRASENITAGLLVVTEPSRGPASARQYISGEPEPANGLAVCDFALGEWGWFDTGTGHLSREGGVELGTRQDSFSRIVQRLRDLAHDPKASCEAFEEALADLEEWKASAVDYDSARVGTPVAKDKIVPLIYSEVLPGGPFGDDRLETKKPPSALG